MIINKAKSLKGEVQIPGDKSISHRSIMFGSLADGKTKIHNFLQGADCLSTISCFREMGVEIDVNQSEVIVNGVGINGLKKPNVRLCVGNSGTTIRILSGILAAQNFSCLIDGDSSIRKRPMKRIIEPITQMGGKIKSLNEGDCAPLQIEGTQLNGIDYNSPISSAQVKSCILMAGLFATGETKVTEPVRSRDHTERMLQSFGVPLITKDLSCSINKVERLLPIEITIPGDISSAAYFMAAGLIVPNSEILLKNVGINPTRDGIIEVIQKMGGNLQILNRHTEGHEHTADILVKTSELNGIVIEGDIIPRLIDEIPMIAILASQASGDTIIRDAQELKFKETNRINYICNNLTAMGGEILPTSDGMIIHGGNPLKGCIIDSGDDHRIAMAFAIAGLVAQGETIIPDDSCINISYPGFRNTIDLLVQK